MTLREKTRDNTLGVPGRMSVRVRLVLCSLLLAAVAIGGGVWLSSHVDLGSAALATVEQNAPEAIEKPDEPETLKVPDEPAAFAEAEEAEESEEAEGGEEPAADVNDGTDTSPVEPADSEPAEDGQRIFAVDAKGTYSATEVKSDPAPESSSAQSQPQDQSQQQSQQTQQQSQQSQPSQSQPQQQGGSQQPTTPVTPQPEPTVTPEPEPVQPQTLSVSVTVDGSAAGSPGWSKTLTLDPGSTVYDALVAADGNVNARSTGYGIYVVGIDGLAEKDHGSKSGWMYAVNGSYPNTACSNYVLKNGDSVTWVYVNVDY